VVQAMARLGVADAQLSAGKYDEAVTGLKAMMDEKAADIPADGVLMQLGRAYRLAGKHSDAKAILQSSLPTAQRSDASLTGPRDMMTCALS